MKFVKISFIYIKLSIDFVYLYIVLIESVMMKCIDLEIRIREKREQLGDLNIS